MLSRRHLLACFFVLFFSVRMASSSSNCFHTSGGGGDRCTGARYSHTTLTNSDLIDELAMHPCCSKNCCAVLLSLPFVESMCCSSCTNNKKSVAAPAQTADEVDLQIRFLQCVSASREAWRYCLPKNGDLVAQKVEKAKQLQDELLRHFRHHGKQRGTSWTWEAAYTVHLHNGGVEKVCKSAWCAIYGVTVGSVNTAQEKVKSGEKPTASLKGGDKEKVSLRFRPRTPTLAPLPVSSLWLPCRSDCSFRCGRPSLRTGSVSTTTTRTSRTIA
jgi:hypothetical protein